MKQDTWNGIKRVSANIELIAVFLIISNTGMIINADVLNAKT